MKIQTFINEFKLTFVYDLLRQTLTDEQLFEHSVQDGQVTWFKEQMRQMWLMWEKAQAVPESRTDFEIIEQTLDLVDLIAHANRFQRDKTKPFPFESENPRNIEWWRLACQIQELLTDTDPNNCDFEEYKAMIEAQEPANDKS